MDRIESIQKNFAMYALRRSVQSGVDFSMHSTQMTSRLEVH